MECPYYTELDNILKANASITPLCFLCSLQLKCTLALQADTAGASLPHAPHVRRVTWPPVSVHQWQKGEWWWEHPIDVCQCPCSPMLSIPNPLPDISQETEIKQGDALDDSDTDNRAPCTQTQETLPP